MTRPFYWLGWSLSRVAVALIFVVVMAFGIGGCGTLAQVDWPRLVQCGPGVSDIVAIVSRILLADGSASTISDRGKAELQGLANEYGASTVACMIDRLRQDWTAPGAAQDSTRIAAAQRGSRFLADVGTQVE